MASHEATLDVGRLVVGIVEERRDQAAERVRFAGTVEGAVAQELVQHP
jgi:hypothetical protein